MVTLGVAVVVVFVRAFGAGYALLDDDIHVYANPFLNPLSFDSLCELWHRAYEGLYVPLAYTIFAGIALFARVPTQVMSSVGQAVSLSPEPFHTAGVAFHVANVVLAFLLMLGLTRDRAAAWIGALVFAIHPLQVESVCWISELRGLSSGFFALSTLNLLVLARHVDKSVPARSWALEAGAVLGVICAALCKPAAVALPLVGLAIDRGALGTSWRRSVTTALTWTVCVLPMAWITRSVQDVRPAGESLWWQRPFIAGDAFAFYVFKTIVPCNLCAEYGRTPHWVMSHAWTYVVWALPVGLFALAYGYRSRRPILWVGALIFGAFMLPTLGLVPFSYQAYSTVADRYAYLPMVGVGVAASDFPSLLSWTSGWGRVAPAVFVAWALLSFSQSGYWTDGAEFLRHTIDVNPDAAAAHNNLGKILLQEDRADEAIEHFRKALTVDPDDAKAENNLGLALVRVGQLEEAARSYQKAVEINPRYMKAYENLGNVYLQTKQFDAAVGSLQMALSIQPEAKSFNDLGVAFMHMGRPNEGLDAFRRAVELEPDNARYRKNLGTGLIQQGRIEEARPYLVP